MLLFVTTHMRLLSLFLLVQSSCSLDIDSSNINNIQNLIQSISIDNILTFKESVYSNTTVNIENKDILLVGDNNDANINVKFNILDSIVSVSNLNINNCVGGCILSEDSSITIENCLFESNSADEGGAIRTLNGDLSISNSRFTNNKSTKRGGAIFSKNTNISVIETTFTENNSGEGGGIYLSECSGLIDNSYFFNNSAILDLLDPTLYIGNGDGGIELTSYTYETFHLATGGGGVSINGNNVDIHNSIFSNNFALLSGGGMKSDNTNIVNCTFLNNTAGLGGGLFTENSNITFSVIDGNDGVSTGGGMIVTGYSIMDNVICQNNFVSSSQRGRGQAGGGCIRISGEVIFKENTIVRYNTATSGGFMYGDPFSKMTIRGGVFHDCYVTGAAGSMYVENMATIVILGGHFYSNYALRDAGAIFISSRRPPGGEAAYFSISNAIFSNNTSNAAGVIFNLESNLFISNTTFQYNIVAETGGVVLMERGDTLDIRGCTFIGNECGELGGAIYVSGTLDVNIGNSIASQNKALSGSFIYISLVPGNVSVYDNIIKDNYLAESVITVSSSEKVIIENNTLEGGDCECKAVKITGSSRISLVENRFIGWEISTIIDSSSREENSVELIECSFYNNTVGSILSSNVLSNTAINNYIDTKTIRSLELDKSRINTIDCLSVENCDDCVDGIFGITCSCYMYEMDEICHDDGELQVKSITTPGAVFFPDMVEFEIEIVNTGNSGIVWKLEREREIDNQVSIFPSSGFLQKDDSIRSIVNLKPEQGETSDVYLVSQSDTITDVDVEIVYYVCKESQIEVEDDVCESCELSINGDTDSYECTSNGVTLKNLPINDGYWRHDTASLDIRKCFHEDACKGGSEVSNSDEYCESGYRGPYCDICEDNYGRGVGRSCFKCDKSTHVMAILGILFVIFIAICVSLLIAFLIGGVDILVSIFTYPMSDVNKSRFLLKIPKRIPVDQIKILIVVWQILIIFPEIVNITYPFYYDKFIRFISFLSFDIGYLLSVSCIVPNIDFYHRLLTTTIYPICILFILCVTYWISVRRSPGDKVSIRNRHVMVALLLSFFIFTSVSTTIFRVFVCDGTAVPGKSFLRADYTIECYDSRHLAYRIYASFMVAVYPIGIPLAYFGLLFPYNKALHPIGTEDKHMSRSQRNLNREITPSKFLWQDFRPHLYYYESIECIRRILLTGALVFIRPGSTVQTIVAVLLAFFCLLGFEILRPHINPYDTWTYRMGTVVVFLTNYMGLLIRVQDDFTSNLFFEFILITLNIILILFVIISTAISTKIIMAETDEITEYVDTLASSHSQRLPPRT